MSLQADSLTRLLQPADAVPDGRPRLSLLDDRMLFRVEGVDAREFLSRQLTCDIAELDPAHSVHGAWLSPKGRVLALLRVLLQGRQILMLTDAAGAEQTMRRLSMFVLRSDVRIERDTERAAVGLVCDASTEIAGLEALTAPGQCVDWNGVSAISLGSSPQRVLLIAARDDLHARCTELLDVGAYAAPLSHWHRIECEAGVPHLDEQTIDAFVPQMLNLDRTGAVSFSKGCYPGQEIVARTQHLGRIKRRMYVLTIDGEAAAIQPGDALERTDQSSSSPGRVVCSAPLAARSQVALGVLPIDEVSGGARYRVGDAIVSAISEPPYGVDTRHV